MANNKKESENLDQTKTIKRAHFVSKPLRPDSTGKKKKVGKAETAYERLARLAEEEEKRKELNRIRKQSSNTGKAGEKGSSSGPAALAKIRQNESSLILVVAVSVIVLILLIWFSSSVFLSGMAKRHGKIASGTGKAQHSEQVKDKGEDQQKKEKTSDQEKENAESSKAPAEVAQSKKPDPLTEGDAEFRVPESWVGKSFAVKDDANVRSGPGTASGVIGSVDPGEIIEVHKAESLDDATWLFGIITKKDGAKMEGWIYAYAVSPAAR